MAHHFAENVLGIESKRIIPCDLADEALERIILGKLPRAAHIMLTDLPFARHATKQNGTAVSLALSAEDQDIAPFEDTIAIRSDWAPLLNAINQSLEFLRRNGAIKRIQEKNSGEYGGTFEILS